MNLHIDKHTDSEPHATSPLTLLELSPFIQHTLFAQDLTDEQVDRHCEEALTYGFNAVMIAGAWVGRVAQRLHGTPIHIASAIDFPPSGLETHARAEGAAALVEAGATSIDIGLPIGYLKSGHDEAFQEAIAAVVRAIHPFDVKVMLELPLLTDDERARAVKLSVEAGAQWLKNASSGAVGKASPADIRFLRANSPSTVKIKASGGINTAEHLRELIEAGATLAGTSNGIAIVTDSAEVESHY